MDGHWKFQGGGGPQRQKFSKEAMKLNLNFWMGRGVQTKEPSVGEVWIYSGNTYFQGSLLWIS